MDLISFPDESRVWVFQANEPIPDEALNEAHFIISEFAKAWTSHQIDLRSTGSILHNRFVVLVVDETKAGASGCSIDTAMRFVQDLGKKYHVDFLDRMKFTYVKDDTLYTVSRDELRDLYDKGVINDSTLIYDNLVNNKSDFLSKWVVPLGDSWLRRMVA